MNKIDLVLQGPANQFTIDAAVYYLNSDVVDKVIISCYETCKIPDLIHNRIKVVRIKDLEFPGLGNVNRQITTSLNGLKNSFSQKIGKIRSDQMIHLDDLKMIVEFIYKDDKIDIEFLDGSGPAGPIFITSYLSDIPFHPRDHIFFGFTWDLIKMFEIPFNSETPPLINSNTLDKPDQNFIDYVRPEVYIGMHYFARFNSKIAEYIKEPKQYINVSEQQTAPMIQKTWDEYLPIRDKIFKLLPLFRIDFPKYGKKGWKYINEQKIRHSEIFTEEHI